MSESDLWPTPRDIEEFRAEFKAVRTGLQRIAHLAFDVRVKHVRAAAVAEVMKLNDFERSVLHEVVGLRTLPGPPIVRAVAPVGDRGRHRVQP